MKRNELSEIGWSFLIPNGIRKGTMFRKLSPQKGKTLIVCHGKKYDLLPGYELADTLDIAPDAQPTILMDISKGSVPFAYKRKYDHIVLQYCLMVAYLNVEDFDSFAKRKQVITANRKTFINLYSLLKTNGTVIINNFDLYTKNVRNPQHLNLFNKTMKFLEPVSDLFDFVELVPSDGLFQLVIKRRD